METLIEKPQLVKIQEEEIVFWCTFSTEAFVKELLQLRPEEKQTEVTKECLQETEEQVTYLERVSSNKNKQIRDQK